MIAAVVGDALGTVRDLAPPHVDVRGPEGVGEADFVVMGWGDDDALRRLERSTTVRAVQSMAAGTEWLAPHVPPQAVLCSARGSRDPTVAEWCVGALLGASTGLLTAARRRRWDDVTPGELHGAHVVILGFGSIGRATAERLAPFGVRVTGVASRRREGAAGPEDLPVLLPTADAVVVLAPLTDATRSMVDATFLGRLRDGALLVNAGRGAVVDTDALVEELRAGRLRAVLDVTDPEPLPAGHPLWDLALAVTPHNAGDSHAADARTARLAAEQLGRFARGEPLLHVVRG